MHRKNIDITCACIVADVTQGWGWGLDDYIINHQLRDHQMTMDASYAKCMKQSDRFYYM
jgi:hypothetical protein